MMIIFLAVMFAFRFTTYEQTNPLSAMQGKWNVMRTSQKPGSAIAVKLKYDSKNKPHLICSFKTCEKLSTQEWTLIPTSRKIRGSQHFSYLSSNKVLHLIEIPIEVDLFETINQRITKLKLPQRVITSIETNSGLIDEEKKYNQFLYKLSINDKLSENWSLPLDSKTTSVYGSLRELPNNEKYYHSGTDFRAAINTPIKAASDGIVIGTDQQTIAGNVVTINHGRGVCSQYFHLTQFNVTKGEHIQREQIIGFSGSSGRTEAPHLHFEIRVFGEPVDPVSTLTLLAHLSDPK